MYAIRNKKTKKFVYGTDYRQRYTNKIAKQRTSSDRALTYEDRESAEMDMLNRNISKTYEVVEVTLTIV